MSPQTAIVRTLRLIMSSIREKPWLPDCVFIIDSSRFEQLLITEGTWSHRKTVAGNRNFSVCSTTGDHGALERAIATDLGAAGQCREGSGYCTVAADYHFFSAADVIEKNILWVQPAAESDLAIPGDSDIPTDVDNEGVRRSAGQGQDIVT